MKMKKIMILCLLLLVVTTTAFAENIVLENQTNYPIENEKSKIAVQWATSAKEVEEANKAVTYGSKLNLDAVQVLPKPGKINLQIPDKAAYFRILVWSKGQKEPDLLTNWVEIVPDKTYTLKPDHLVPAVLMSGTGC